MNRQQFDSLWARTFNKRNAHLFAGMGLAFLAIAAACYLGGCALNAAGYYRSVSTGAVGVNLGYLALKQTDAVKTQEIVITAHQHPEQAKAENAKWAATADKAQKALDVFHDTVIGALREGPPIQGLILNPKSYQKWLDALTVAGAAVGLALSDAGIDWQALLLSGGK